MNDIVAAEVLECAVREVERMAMMVEQVSAPVVHRFGPGIYIREVSIAAGTFTVGHYQTHEHLNVMLKGRVTMFGEDGQWREAVAPLIYTSAPGRKIGIVTEDMVWLNIYPTDERDIDKLEATYLRKSEEFKASEQELFDLQYALHQPDRDDFALLLVQYGLSAATVQAQSEDESDQVPMPEGYPVRVLRSPINGQGLFHTCGVGAGELIAPALILGKRTPAGRYTNHSRTPNAMMHRRADGNIDLVALRDIAGCAGGGQGEEITIDYRQALRLAIGGEPCQA